MGTNPIVLDDFTSAIDIGNTLFGDSNTRFKLNYIEWQEPTTQNHTATITDNGSEDILNETCTTANQSIIKYFDGMWVTGIKIAGSGVQSGKIIVALS